ncbi:MAG: hypothetical protein ACRDTV_05295, partial [Mycobacterium sp.]
DRLWWKYKTSELRAIVTKLTPAELAAPGIPAEATVDGKLAFVTDFRRPLYIDAPEPADPPLGKRHDWR